MECLPVCCFSKLFFSHRLLANPSTMHHEGFFILSRNVFWGTLCNRRNLAAGTSYDCWLKLRTGLLCYQKFPDRCSTALLKPFIWRTVVTLLWYEELLSCVGDGALEQAAHSCLGTWLCSWRSLLPGAALEIPANNPGLWFCSILRAGWLYGFVVPCKAERKYKYLLVFTYFKLQVKNMNECRAFDPYPVRCM